MSRRLLLLVLMAVLGLTACGGPTAIQWRAADGRSGSLADLQGRWLLVNWWAIWCAPCREEIPEFNHLDAETDDATLLLLAVNFDGPDAAALEEARAALDLQFPMLLPGHEQAMGLTRPEVLPSTVLINPQGQVVTTLVGPQTGEQLRAALAAAGVPLG